MRTKLIQTLFVASVFSTGDALAASSSLPVATPAAPVQENNAPKDIKIAPFSAGSSQIQLQLEQFKAQKELLFKSNIYKQFRNKYQGTESGGGGGLIETPYGLLLVDFLHIATAPEKILTAYAEASRISTQVQPQDPAFLLARQIIKGWSDLPYDIFGVTVQTALDGPVVWNFTEDPLPVQSLSEEESAARLQLAAYYTAQGRQFRVNVSRTVWNQMSLLNQAGLLIHEALRHVQIGYKFGFDEESLQQATAMLVMCEPQSRLTYYLQYLMMGQKEAGLKIYGTYPEITQNTCRRKL